MGLPVKDTADFIAGCEAAGFSGVGMHDHQHSGRDVFLTLALAAERTSRLTVYPATTNPVTRHPMVLASLAHSLEEIAPERVRLTVGPGYLAVGNIGQPRATVDAMRQAILTIRGLLRGERLQFNGVESRLRNVSDRPTPVFMTAAGPRMVELAGEVADGAMLLVGLHPKAVEAARRRLEIGAARSGRSLDGFQTIFITPTTVSDDGPGARRFPQQWFRHDQPYLKYPSDSNLVWLREAGIDLAADFVPESISDDLAAEICDAFRPVRHARGMPGPAETRRKRIGRRPCLHIPHSHAGRRLRHAAGRCRRFPRHDYSGTGLALVGVLQVPSPWRGRVRVGVKGKCLIEGWRATYPSSAPSR